MKKTFCVLSLFAAALLGFPGFAQVSIAPTSIFIDANGIGTIYVTNPSETPQEVSVSFVFGYPGNDESGSLSMVYQDSVRAKQFGLEDRIRAFPRTFLLAPLQQQTVRLQVRPDRSLPSGTYFTRIKVSSNIQTPDVETTTQEGVSTQVNFRFDQVVAAFYKVGDTDTGLEIGEVETTVEDKKLKVVSAFNTTGNSPFLGSVYATLKNADKQRIAEQQQTVALYFSGKRALEISLPDGLPSGRYELELRYETRRTDIPRTDLVQSTPVIKSVSVLIE